MQRRTTRRARLLAGAAIVVLLSGCASVDRRSTASVASANKPIEQMTAVELQTALPNYQRLYERNPDDKSTAMAFASVLRMNGRNDQALAVMRKAAIQHPEDRVVLAAYGKALASAGDFTAALDAIQRAQDPTQPDWRLMSAEGAIYDQTGRSQQARARYQRALQLRPNEPSVLSNLAMSHILEGDLPTAETYLRTAVDQPGADSRVRQNLAMVVGLQGRFQEARSIAQRELSPEQAAANMEYLERMLSQQNAWALIKQEDRSAAAN
ncbi:MAG: tetratricopeptide repeat protein [Pseudomonadota bacterium]